MFRDLFLEKLQETCQRNLTEWCPCFFWKWKEEERGGGECDRETGKTKKDEEDGRDEKPRKEGEMRKEEERGTRSTTSGL